MQPDFRLQKILLEINELSSYAYQKIFLVANPFLSKMGIQDLLSRYLNGESPKSYGPIMVGIWIVKNYIISISYLLNLYIAKKNNRNSLREGWELKNVAIIDSYINLEHNFNPHSALNGYLPHIIDVLKDKYDEIVILPRVNDYSKVSTLLKYASYEVEHEKIYFLNQSDVLSGLDFIYLFILIISQPFRLLCLKKYTTNSREGAFIRQGIVESILQNDFHGIIRGMVGRRLGEILAEKIVIYQWFENQVMDRAFNANMRAINSKARIIGLQLFLWPPELLNCFLIPEDFGPHLPDVVHVNGKNFLQHHPYIEVKVGPSLRYDHVNLNDVVWNKYGKKLVLLPYYALQAEEIIAVVCKAFVADKVLFRFHPASTGNIKDLLPEGYRFSQNSLIADLREASCVIGSASGSLVEALVLGIPVVVLESNTYTNYNYMPALGKGLIWESVKVNENLSTVVDRLVFSETNDSYRSACRLEIRDSYFKFSDKNEILK